MGYSYSMSGKLCCDSCGQPGGVRKRKCPHNYCPPPALCSACYKAKKGELAEYHATSCAAGAAKYAEKAMKIAKLYASGAVLRCAARTVWGGRVHVLFQGCVRGQPAIGYYMAPETYDAISLGEPATPEDFAKFGKLEPAPGEFQLS